MPLPSLSSPFAAPHAVARHRSHAPLRRPATADLFSAPQVDNSAMPPRPHENCYWVIPGRLMAGEYPGARDAALGRDCLVRTGAAGVRHFIDLTEAHELAPYHPLLPEISLTLDRPVGHERWAIHDVDVPRSADYANRILDRIDALVAVDAVPYVHCWGGIGRTGTMIGCWLVRHGNSGEEALDILAGHWATVAKRTRHPRSPETDAQCRFILDWARHDTLRSGAAASE